MLRARSTHTRITALTAVLATFLVALVAVAPAQASSTIKSKFFGMHAPRYGTTFPEVGTGSVNLTLNQVYWPQLEPTEGSFDFTALDTLVDQAHAHGAQPLLVLGMTPDWASTTHTGTGSVPKMGAWRDFVKAVVDQYGKRLDYQVWPEANASHFNWAGSQPQLAQLVGTASKIIHGVAPKAVVVSPAMVIRKPVQVTKMSKFFAQKFGGKPIGHYVDAVGLDAYPLEDGTPEDSAALIRTAHGILAKRKVSAPLWNVEINYGVAGSHVPVTPLPMRQQSSYVARNYLLDAANGIQRVYWLAWANVQELGIQMVAADQVTPTPAAAALSTVETWMTGRQVRSCARDKKSKVWTCTLMQKKQASWVYWRSSGHAKVHAPKGARHVESLDGTQARTATGKPLKVTSTPMWVHH